VNPIEERVFEFVASETGVRRRKLKLSTRLREDIRMDGDDAVEFFQAFAMMFDADLTSLWNNWDGHFGPEAASSWPAIRALIASVLVAILAGSAIPGIPRWALLLAAVAMWFGLSRLQIAGGGDPDMQPITIQDLVDAAMTRRWIRSTIH
jgi:AcrR family transcriptional regulator